MATMKRIRMVVNDDGTDNGGTDDNGHASEDNDDNGDGSEGGGDINGHDDDDYSVMLVVWVIMIMTIIYLPRG